MQKLVLVIHVMIALALTGVVLIQRSEGGGLGVGGGQTQFMSGRGTANLLTRVTAVLAAAFMVTSVVLVVLEGQGAQRGSVLQGTTTRQGAPTLPGGAPAPVPTFPTAPGPTNPAPVPAFPAPAPAGVPGLPPVPIAP